MNIYINPNDKYLSKKVILKFLFICFVLLLIDSIESTLSIIKNNNNNHNYKKNVNQEYEDDFIFIEYLIIFLASKYTKEVYYKHQNISFLILIIVEAIKTIYFFIKNNE